MIKDLKRLIQNATRFKAVRGGIRCARRPVHRSTTARMLRRSGHLRRQRARHLQQLLRHALHHGGAEEARRAARGAGHRRGRNVTEVVAQDGE